MILFLCSLTYAVGVSAQVDWSDNGGKGQPAPDFTLPDVNGDAVGLSDYKGKIVYLDFWGVWCAPCYREFESATGRLKEKYNENDIVYLYVCIVPDGEKWKEIIKQYGLEGVHLLADGFGDGSVYKAYNVGGVPHYTLIDREGNIVFNDGSRPSELLADTPNELDELIESDR